MTAALQNYEARMRRVLDREGGGRHPGADVEVGADRGADGEVGDGCEGDGGDAGRADTGRLAIG